MKQIFCRIDRCLACRSCEIACAVVNSRSKRLTEAVSELPVPRYRIRVQNLDEGRSGERQRTMALQCRHCHDPGCVEACIAGGIVRDEITGVVSFNQEKCVGCWSCTMVCRFGAVIRDKKTGIAVKCDRCLDREIPACVESCPTNALVFCEPEELD
ncbi:hypothetical protein BVY01_01535 [bacterium I07]|nr:hypothetical protein BVY01_01535 [bacterium I07]